MNKRHAHIGERIVRDATRPRRVAVMPLAVAGAALLLAGALNAATPVGAAAATEQSRPSMPMADNVANASHVSGARQQPAPRLVPSARSIGMRGGIDALVAHLAQPRARAIVLVSTPGCGFCKLVRELHLGPLRADAKYDDMPAFEIQLSSSTKLSSIWPKAFSSLAQESLRTEGDLARALGAQVAPTVLFTDGRRFLAPALIGYQSNDFYWAYLSQRISESRINAH